MVGKLVKIWTHKYVDGTKEERWLIEYPTPVRLDIQDGYKKTKYFYMGKGHNPVWGTRSMPCDKDGVRLPWEGYLWWVVNVPHYRLLDKLDRVYKRSIEKQ